jgi:hypothetical protein
LTYCEYENHSLWSCCSALLECDCWVSCCPGGDRGTCTSPSRSADCGTAVDDGCGARGVLFRGGVGSGSSSSSSSESMMNMGVLGHVSWTCGCMIGGEEGSCSGSIGSSALSLVGTGSPIEGISGSGTGCVVRSSISTSSNKPCFIPGYVARYGDWIFCDSSSSSSVTCPGNCSPSSGEGSGWGRG